MLNTLQTNFKLNQSSYMMSTPQKSEQQVAAADGKTTENKGNRNILYASLGGLAVLGSIGVWVKMRNPKAVETIVNEPVQNRNIMEIIRLRNIVREEYLVQRQAITDKFFGEDSGIHSIKELIQKINISKVENTEKKAQYEDILVKNRLAIREKIASLQNDEEWIKLRGLRKNLVAIYNGQASREEKAIASQKLLMINDLIINKTNPEEIENFKRLYCMEPVSAIKLVESKFNSVQEYNKAFKEAQTLDFGMSIPVRTRNFTHFRPLQLQDVLPDQAGAYINANNIIQKAELELSTLKNKYSEYHNALTELASQFRESENVNALKNLLC